MITEKQFEAQIKDLAKLFGYTYYHTWRSIHSPSGWPDCVFARLEPEPKFIIAELKTDDLKNSQPSFEQYAWLYLLQHLGKPHGIMGFDAWLWRPSDFDTEIVEVLR